MSEPKQCLRCKEIVTFCECEKPITDKDEYIEWLENTREKYDALLMVLAIENSKLIEDFLNSWYDERNNGTRKRTCQE